MSRTRGPPSTNVTSADTVRCGPYVAPGVSPEPMPLQSGGERGELVRVHSVPVHDSEMAVALYIRTDPH
eukprot:CAMPEP_0198681162 /NCGR_PEP_ID=MMETSP1468-20131203/6277_1 /TAXON_ID=1461545 /ORGANISM="Mantoniella sp, Strain CCMP1436" /LENGTH=68 /DNA_ID=CAMNT_0044422501 /DNA_START=60 /DNA_END=266 /DNA_ORIENTATION=-